MLLGRSFKQGYIGDYSIQLYEGYNKPLLGGGNSNIFYVHPKNWGRFIPILTCAYFSDGLVQPPTRKPVRKLG